MPELLLFAFDHRTAIPTPSVAQIAALPKPMDLVTHQADGWPWGASERNHPWFRIVHWPQALPADLDALLSPLLPSGGSVGLHGTLGTPQFLGQFRGFHLDLSVTNANLPAGFAAWWADNSRAAQRFTIAAGAAMTVANSKLARAAIANLAHIGPTTGTIG